MRVAASQPRVTTAAHSLPFFYWHTPYHDSVSGQATVAHRPYLPLRKGIRVFGRGENLGLGSGLTGRKGVEEFNMQLDYSTARGGAGLRTAGSSNNNHR